MAERTTELGGSMTLFDPTPATSRAVLQVTNEVTIGDLSTTKVNAITVDNVAITRSYTGFVIAAEASSESIVTVSFFCRRPPLTEPTSFFVLI